MDPFEILPEIELEELCKGWNDRMLLNVSAASSRVYQICSEEREKRKKRYFERLSLIKKESEVFNKLLSEISIQLKKEFDGIQIWLTLTLYGSKVYVSQIVEPEEAENEITWLVKDPEGYPLKGNNRGISTTRTQAKDIIIEALKQGYIPLKEIELY